jgi:hypothetical protein
MQLNGFQGPILMRTLRTLTLGLIAAFLVGTGIAQAVAPQFDKGTAIDLNDIYTNAEPVTNLFSNTGVYGKLDSTSTADVYKIVPDRDGDQTLSLAGHAASTAQPFLVLVDPTDATQSRDLGIPLPTEEGYHTALMTAVDGLQKYYEPATFEQYNLYAQQRVHFQKDKTYYVIVFDPTRQLTRYVLKFGDAKVWGFGDIFVHFGSWIKLKGDSYGGSSPFTFTPSTFGAILFFLAFGFMVGMWIMESAFGFMANKSKMAGYILIKMQKYSRIFTWIALWFIALGGYIYFDAIGWPGIPFFLGVIFILITAVYLVRTLWFSPQLMKLEVSKQEAAIPLPLLKWQYIFFILSTITLGGFILLLTMQFS